jgi:hypothetical protein
MFKPVSKLVSGILLLFIYTGLWINGMFINRPRGTDIMLGLPLLVGGAFLILGWYRSTRLPYPSRSREWKFILGLLMVSYLVFYLMYIISETVFWSAIDLMSIPGIILPLLLGLFLTAFILSWKNEFAAGICLILWYALVLFGQFRYTELLQRGPYLLIGIILFIHGILYLAYHYRIRPGN